MKTLTNERSVIAFKQYGELKDYHYYGSLKSARNSLKRNCGDVEIIKEHTRTSCGFLTSGLSSITEHEERYF
jgi:hypothetical protein